MANYLDKDGVLYLWSKVKALFNKGITGLSVNGRTITYTKGDGTTGTITTQDTNTTYGVVSKTANGLVPKLPDETTTTKYLRQDGAWVVPPNTTYGVMKGATASADGASGLVPAPTKGDSTRYLTSDGKWSSILFPTYPLASSSLDGLMSRNDKAKLNGIENGANKTIVDDTLSDTSTNPVQNKIVKTKIDIVENLANQANIQAGEVASAIKYGALPTDVGFIYKDTGGTSYGLFNDLTSFVDLSPYAKKADIVGTYKYKGSVDTASVLPTSGQTTGDVYNIVASSSYGPAGCNVAWNGSDWDSLGGIFTITSISNSELDRICV